MGFNLLPRCADSAELVGRALLEGAPVGAGVFVSYRKDDDPGWAGRVRDSLAHHFGDDNVFFDVNSIRAGQRWEDAPSTRR